MTTEPGEHPLDEPEDPRKPGEAAPGEAAPAQVPAYSSSSGDELNTLLSASPAQLQPDPFLGRFSSGDSQEAPVASVEGPPSESFDAAAALIAFTDPTPVEPVLGPAIADPTTAPEERPVSLDSDSDSDVSLPASPDRFPAIDLSAPPSAAPAPKPIEEDFEDDDDLPNPPRSWVTLLLFSYASAVTLGLIWVLMSGRKVREADTVEPASVTDNRPDPGLRADRSRKTEPRAPLPADHVTSMGKPIRTGSLEVTPLEVAMRPVRLERAVAEHEQRQGGDDALWLKLRLKNTSSDTIFAPMDEAFIREREGGLLDSVIEAKQGHEIGMYPLAVSSEWTIVGQEFRELRPGQAFDTYVVSASDVADHLTPELTWRVRLRTGMNQTDTIGVRFGKDDVKAAQ